MYHQILFLSFYETSWIFTGNFIERPGHHHPPPEVLQLLPMHHGHFNKAFLLGQKHVECSRMSIEGLWRATHCNHDSITSFFFVKWVGGTLLVRGYEPCSVWGNLIEIRVKHNIWNDFFKMWENNRISAQTHSKVVKHILYIVKKERHKDKK